MVSLRDGLLKLIGLRGKFMVGKDTLGELALVAGQTIRLSERTLLEVLEVQVPVEVMALSHPALGTRPIHGTMSLVRGQSLQATAGAVRGAVLVIWSDADRWFARRGDGVDIELWPGLELDVDGEAVRVVTQTTSDGGESTALDRHAIDSPLHLVVRYDSVHLRREEEVLVFDGFIARILSDLAIASVPMSWSSIARELWPDENDMLVLRRNWDATLARMRKKLRAARIRTDLVRADHGGNFELVLRRSDRLEDQT